MKNRNEKEKIMLELILFMIIAIVAAIFLGGVLLTAGVLWIAVKGFSIAAVIVILLLLCLL